ncbi:MAG TPA: SUMF1/EgtB/PvdO family nonheme iron enzyme, partial [Planctomycetota bacterium]|nr:SUMF1/EgtB/PvdO family nonheme iron enzyme [Planctomycetota bacterium]
VGGVLFAEAQAYAEWAGKRLPTLAEFQRAYEGGARRRYPWGDDVGDRERLFALFPRQSELPDMREHATFEAYKLALYLACVRPVGSEPFTDSVDGVADLFGNVVEWTSSLGAEYDEGARPGGGALEGASGWLTGLAAGKAYHPSFLFPFSEGEWSLQVSPQPRTARLVSIGFRCARSGAR